MAPTRQLAIWYASDIVSILTEKTGHDYSVRTERPDLYKWLHICDETTKEPVITYQATTWTAICDQIVVSCKTYNAIMNA